MPRFVPRERKQKRQKKDSFKSSASVLDTNQIQIIPQSLEGREAERRKRPEGSRAEQPHVSGKKQKRLNKYLETKLKKDEALELLKKLSRQQFDTSQLQSSKHLGKRKRDQRTEPNPGVVQVEEHSSSSDESGFSHCESADDAEAGKWREQDQDRSLDVTRGAQTAQGSGLREPLQLGSDGLPIIHTKRKTLKRRAASVESWEGFDDDNDVSQPAETQMTEDDGLPGVYGKSLGLLADIDSVDSAEEQDSDNTMTTESDEGTEESDHPTERTRIKPRSSVFKMWATEQINNSLGHVPFQGMQLAETANPASRPVVKETTSLEPANGQHTIQEEERKLNVRAYNVLVSRSAEVETLRSQLPIVAEEQKIMEAVLEHPCVIIWGTTGSGKTTQVPQFLYEAGYGSAEGPRPGMIGITQPRRVAAVSMSRRVSEELGEHGDKVSHQIRFESTTLKSTAIKFMTDGILLREITQDFALLKYSVIIIDEAHERSVNTDLLIGMLSRIVELRRKMSSEDSSVPALKLIIMSATLRISDFLQDTNLFPWGRPPLVQAEGRLFPVTEHFSRSTRRDYLEETFKKVSRGHRKLPPGGMLVFLTGQNEIKTLIHRLEEVLSKAHQSSSGGYTKVQISATEAPLETEDLELGAADASEYEDEETDANFPGPDAEDEDHEFEIGDPASAKQSSVHILPLYSQLPTQEQLRVFEPPPEGSRLIVIATNVAETSLTIPGIRYVFDCGRSKDRVYDPLTGIQQFEVGWISKSSAEQRAGRAGRTGPGHCYRLYSSAVYERDFVAHTEPEILRTPIESVVLQLKTMGLNNVVKFPFPTRPSQGSLVKAEHLLRNLGALDDFSQVTPLGRSLSIYPLSPRYGKMLAIGSQHGCLPYVIALVSGLAVGDVFIPENQLDLHPRERSGQDNAHISDDGQQEDAARERRRKAYNRARGLFSKNDPTSDAIRLLSAICASAYEDNPDRFCRDMFLRSKAVKEISQLRKQLSDIVRANHPELLLGPYTARLPCPSSKQVKALSQIVAASFIDQVAMRADLSPNEVSNDISYQNRHRNPKRAIDVPYMVRSQHHCSAAAAAGGGGGGITKTITCYIHPSSQLSCFPPKQLPQYIIYSHLQQSTPSHITTANSSTPNALPQPNPPSRPPPKLRIHPLTPIPPAQLSALAHDTPLLSYGKPIGKIDVLAGRLPERRECWVVPFLNTGEDGGAVGVGWPLPARKVVQRREFRRGGGGGVKAGGGDGWVVERFLV